MRPNLSSRFKIAVFAIICSSFSLQLIAQAPVNDVCSAAKVITSGTGCNPVSGTFIKATKSSPFLAAPVNSYTANGTLTSYGSIAGLTVECWGAGGGGGFGSTRGGGGGGGGYSSGLVSTVSAGATYTINVGTAGAGGTGAGAAASGTVSNFTDALGTAYVSANGGAGGNSSGTAGTGATTGTNSNTTNNIFWTGGNGAAGAGANSGGGGGGAGSTNNGGNAFLFIAGSATALNGGAGGAGQNSGTTAGGAAAIYGGGGGGGRGANGGAGAKGLVQVTVGDTNSLDLWYSFTAASVNPTIVLSNIGTDLSPKSPYIQLFSGTCGSLTSKAVETDGSMSTSGLTIGTVYYIRVGTIVSFASPSTGNYTFSICVQDPLTIPTNSIDYSKAYINITDGTVGGTINQNDILEIRATLVVKAGTITNVSYYDTLKRNAGFIFKDSIATRTNEGKNFATFTNAAGDDAGWLAVTPLLDTSIQINIGTGATSATGGSLTYNTSKPSLFGSTCIIMATYRVRVDTGLIGYGRKINFGGGAFKYTLGGTNYTISFPRDSLIAYATLSACSDAISPGNLIGSANNGNFGTLTAGSSASGTQNGGPASINTTYNYETYSTGPNDYYYGIANNTSPNNSIVQSAAKPGSSRVFQLWDITGDHTGATNTAKGNPPCNPNLPVSTTNPCGYMLTINSSYRSDKVFEYTASGICSDTYYEVSAWFKNLCSRCGCDVNGVSSGSAGYIPTAPGDSSGVRPNIAMQIDGIDYYTTGELVYQGLGGAPTATDTLNNWVRRSFVFKTNPLQTSFKVTFRNNAPGGGGNDWAVDDIGLRTCYPTMVYAPTNPIIYVGNTLTITDTVRSYFDNYTYYKWQVKPVAGSWADVVPASTGQATATLVNGQYEYVISYTIPGTATQPANAGDEYRMVIASNAANLLASCNYTPSTTFSLIPADATCALTATNYAIAPQTGHIDWNKLSWSLGHVPTCCESAHITYNSSKGSTDSVVVDIYNDICIINLTLLNTSTTSNQLLKTILHPGYSMLMRGNVRMGATGSSSSTDSCIFIAKGGGTITINGNTVIGYPADNAYCIFGSAPGITAANKYVLRGDSLTFNTKAFTRDTLVSVTMNPFSDTAYLVNNTNAVTFPYAVTFENLKIGNGTKVSAIVAAGTNPNSFLNSRGGTLDVTTNATLILPSNYTINARGGTDTLQVKSNATLKIGGYSGGTTGSNFPFNFTKYIANALSTVEYYGGIAGTQTVYGMAYGKLELRNGADALGTGRAQKNTIAAMSSATSINVNQQTDFTLGTAGSSAQTVVAAGTFNITGGSGLYCNDNVISGGGTFTLGNFSYLGIGNKNGITALGNAAGNMQMTGARNYNTKGNYIYNAVSGTKNQYTGNGLPLTCNDLTIDCPDTVLLGRPIVQAVTGINALKQGIFNIDTSYLKIRGTLTTTGGKMKANKAILEMAGTSGAAQTIAGSWFLNRNISTLIDSNTVGTTIAATAGDTLIISSALLYGTGTTSSAIRTNDNLTLLSRDTATARFGVMVGGDTIIGKVNVERYISINRKWRHLAWNTTSSQTPMQSWMEGNMTPNANAKPGYGTIVTDEKPTWNTYNFDSRSVSGPSVKYYDSLTNTYIGIPNTLTYAMNSHSAYYNFVRGDRSCLPANGSISPTILRSTGTLKTGIQAFNVLAGKFGAIGNPYASAIDLRGLDTLNLTSTFYVWDPQLTGSYGLGAYQTIYKSGTNYIILPGGGSYGLLSSQVDTLESGQAMFVRARATAGTLTFKETAKTIGKRTMSRQGNITENAFALLYFKEMTAGSPLGGTLTLLDGCLTNFDDENANSVDYEDALKLQNTGENAGFRRNSQILSIERRHTVVSDDTLFLNLTSLRIHKYQWDLILENMDKPGRTGFFIDKYLNSSTALNLNGSTPMEFDVQNITGSWANDRFMIVFHQAAIVPVHFTSISAVRNGDKTVTVKWDAENEINMQDYKIEYSADGNHFAAIGTAMPTANNGGSASYEFIDGHATAGYNYYRIRGNSINGHVDYTAIAKVGPLSTEPMMSINPNPVNGNTLNLRFENQPKGTYTVSISNKIGQVLHTETVTVQNGNFTKIITIGTKAAPGSYQAVIMDAVGKMTTIPFIVE